MKDAITALFGSRKFIVMLLAQLAVFFPAVFGKISPDLAAELGVLLVTVWSASHAAEESAKAKAAAPPADNSSTSTINLKE